MEKTSNVHQPKYPNKWINKLCYIHTTKHYSATQRDTVLRYATTWMNLDDIMLNEIPQSQRDKYYDSTYMRDLESQNHTDRK